MKASFLIILSALLSFHSYSQTSCATNGDGGDFADYQLFSTSGNYFIDQLTVLELQFMQTRFLVYPVLYFYEGDNAMATKQQYSVYGPDGTVAFGFQLFRREALRDPNGSSIAIIIAHEFGHIVQFKYGGFTGMPTFRKELFADYLAGAYLRIRGGLNITAVLESFREMGDENYDDINHHGTPKQREGAIRKGFTDAGTYGYSFTLSKAISLGKIYVNAIPDPDPTEKPGN